MSSRPATLFVSYDGMLEPLGQSQVIAYQELLAEHFDVHLLSFEKSADWSRTGLRSHIAERLSRAGIHWHPRRYHKRPSAIATAFDIVVGIATGWMLVSRNGIRLLHARSYVAAVICLVLKRLTGAKFLFDMRGFWADERVDGGLWSKNGRLFRVSKWFERHFLLHADAVISLTHAAVREMEQFPYLAERMPKVSVIPTCADLTLFRPRPENTSRSPLTVGYVGSVGTWYMFDEVVTAFLVLRNLKPDARLLIVNKGEHALIRKKLLQADVPPEAFELTAAAHAEVPALMQRMHVGIFFIKPAFSKQASAPTKLGEFLGCGIPCLTNTGVGDMAAILRSEAVGIAISSFDPAPMEEGIRGLLALLDGPGVQSRCTAAAMKYFSLEHGVACYLRTYRELLA